MQWTATSPTIDKPLIGASPNELANPHPADNLKRGRSRRNKRSDQHRYGGELGQKRHMRNSAGKTQL